MICCYVDGGYKNDGGNYSNLTGYGSYKVVGEPDIIIEHKTFNLPEATSNNCAEYLSLIELLRYLVQYNYIDVIIYMDSKLVVNQVNGLWKINYKNLQQLRDTVVSIKVNFELKWTPRENIVKELGH